MIGFVAYQGPSRLDGGPIFVAVTFPKPHGNRKIGEMTQAWVMRSDLPPRDALAAGLDRSICGSCVHRSGGITGRSCYVNTQTGPTSVWQAYQRARYELLSAERAAAALAGEQIRIAAYGDPAALPLGFWRQLTSRVHGFTAYTHQWRTCDQRFRSFCMASVESETEADQAHALGWRTFRTRLETERVRPDEIVCPASNEAGHRATCAACGLCVGLGRPSARSVAIIAHGMRTGWLEQKKAAVFA